VCGGGGQCVPGRRECWKYTSLPVCEALCTVAVCWIGCLAVTAHETLFTLHKIVSL